MSTKRYFGVFVGKPRIRRCKLLENEKERQREEKFGASAEMGIELDYEKTKGSCLQFSNCSV